MCSGSMVREPSVRDLSVQDLCIGWGSVCLDVGGPSMGRGSKCSDPCETCWGTMVLMDASQVIVPGLRSEPDINYHNGSLKKTSIVV